MKSSYCIERALLLGSGGRLEPLVHPKPGGVTRCKTFRGLSIHDFELASIALDRALIEACLSGCRRGCMARGFIVYLETARRLGLRSNVNTGTLLLLLPLACTLDNARDPSTHAVEASKCILETGGGEDAEWYYKVLEYFRPSHLGEYRGPLPPIGSGVYPESLAEVLRAMRWDHVHRELLEGYPITLEAVEMMKMRGHNEKSLSLIILELLSRYGDTLIGRRHGWRAAKRAMREALIVLRMVEHLGEISWVEKLWREWRRRGWSPGSILDIVATALGLSYLHGLVEG